MPKFSVVVPAYNNERHLAAALRSLVVQTEQSWEGLLVDDGSTDGTLEVMWKFASRDPRFRVLTQPNAGRPSVVRNRALAIATGAAVAFLDADDLYHPRKLEAALLGYLIQQVQRISPTGLSPSLVDLSRPFDYPLDF